MQLDNPVFVPNSSFPEVAFDGQMCFLSGVGLHQHIAGQWLPMSGAGTVAAVKESMAQKQVTTTDVLLYTADKQITATELTLVTPETSVEVTLYLKRGSTVYKLFDRSYFDGYLTTIISISIPLEVGDQIFGSATEGPSFNVTLTGVATTNQRLIVLNNVPVGTTTVFAAMTNLTITNILLCNTANADATTTVNIKRADSAAEDAVFLNQLLTAAGEVIMGDISTAINNGSSIQVVTDQVVTLLITAI